MNRQLQKHLLMLYQIPAKNTLYFNAWKFTVDTRKITIWACTLRTWRFRWCEKKTRTTKPWELWDKGVVFSAPSSPIFSRLRCSFLSFAQPKLRRNRHLRKLLNLNSTILTWNHKRFKEDNQLFHPTTGIPHRTTSMTNMKTQFQYFFNLQRQEI